eukprot:c10499_g1_i1.p1 GENE.c10499_g1_i1~~c10499_g1_i1.p1  ORF type:complete len:137 (+),score=19.72 c10499_g1_i1:247-657(+)
MDTAGQEEYSSIESFHISQAQGFLVVYSITDPSTLNIAQDLIMKIRSIHERDDVPIILVGNKSDLGDRRKVSKEEARLLATTLQKVEFYETSASTGDNVAQAFDHVLRLAHATTIKREPETPRRRHSIFRKSCVIL